MRLATLLFAVLAVPTLFDRRPPSPTRCLTIPIRGAPFIQVMVAAAPTADF